MLSKNTSHPFERLEEKKKDQETKGRGGTAPKNYVCWCPSEISKLLCACRCVPIAAIPNHSGWRMYLDMETPKLGSS